MANQGTVEKSGGSSTAQHVIERRLDADEERKLDSHIWSYCCGLNTRELEFAVGNLHFAHVLRKQYRNGIRWFEICRLRSIEIHQRKTGLVRKFEVWMRKLDQNLAHQGVFVGSYTRKYLVHPDLGEIPQMERDDVDIDLT